MYFTMIDGLPVTASLEQFKMMYSSTGLPEEITHQETGETVDLTVNDEPAKLERIKVAVLIHPDDRERILKYAAHLRSNRARFGNPLGN